MKFLKCIINFLILIVLISCEKEIKWKIKKDNRDLIVIDGILTNELKSQHIKLTHSYQELNSPVLGFSMMTNPNEPIPRMTIAITAQLR